MREALCLRCLWLWLRRCSLKELKSILWGCLHRALEQPLSDVLSSALVITCADIDKSQAATLAELLQGEAGFEYGRNGGPGPVTLSGYTLWSCYASRTIDNEWTVA